MTGFEEEMRRSGLGLLLGLIWVIAAGAACDESAAPQAQDSGTTTDALADVSGGVDVALQDAATEDTTTGTLDDTSSPPDTPVADDASADDIANDADTFDAGPEPPPQADVARLTKLLQELSADTMQGRLTGTASGELSEQYIVELLSSLGVDVQTQDVELPLFEVGSPAELSVVDETGQALDSLVYFEEFREVDFSGDGVAEAELVFVGYGIVAGDYDSYEGLDVTGKIVAVLTGIPSGEGMKAENQGRVDRKISAAASNGATGIVFVLAGQEASAAWAQGVETELWASDKYGDVHPDLLAPDVPVAFVHLGATERLLDRTPEQLQSDPTPFDTGHRVRLEIHGTTHLEAVCRNIFAVLPGTDPVVGDEVVILGAHYDHLGVGADGQIFNGAADNASGTAIALETVAGLVEGVGASPARTVVVALWCGEEQGIRGSLEYAFYGTPLFPLADTRMMVQLDYIGGPDGPYLSNPDDNPALELFLGDETEATELPVLPVDWGGQCASDDCAFLLATDVPAYRIIAYGDHHHVPTDTFDNLDLDMIVRVADVVLRGMTRVATSVEPLGL